MECNEILCGSEMSEDHVWTLPKFLFYVGQLEERIEIELQCTYLQTNQISIGFANCLLIVFSHLLPTSHQSIILIPYINKKN